VPSETPAIRAISFMFAITGSPRRIQKLLA
jgi:hypothetical protein